MDFIEQWFGVSPDGGDGSLEALYLVALGVTVAAVVLRKRISRAISRSRSGAAKRP